ncbi:hypothetical protein [Nocardia aurea]|uniref:Uncharacterized protein n=1 Tax=Nocardia aurea TaxID=2144174 RepID=A0ABV3FS97_9NOCA
MRAATARYSSAAGYTRAGPYSLAHCGSWVSAVSAGVDMSTASAIAGTASGAAGSVVAVLELHVVVMVSKLAEGRGPR